MARGPAQQTSQTTLAQQQSVAVHLTAVIVSVITDQPRILVLRPAERRPPALPSGPLELEHRTLEAGLRVWVEAQTGTQLGYVEQLYTFGDRNRALSDGRRVLSIGYLALVSQAGADAVDSTGWQSWYRSFPWEDWRNGRPAMLDELVLRLRDWSAAAEPPERVMRRQRLDLAFAAAGGVWSDERVLERYELLYEAGLVPEAQRDGVAPLAERAVMPGYAEPMQEDHRRILATAIARMRGKIKYRPLVFELLPPAFTFLQLQRTVEALAGLQLHKQNFRRLVLQQGLVEETGKVVATTGGRPAREFRFRREAVLERPAPGVRLRPKKVP